jgi:hypothetical protein
MKKHLPFLVAGLLALPLVAFADSEFYTPIPATGSVAGFIDFEGAADGYANVNVTQSDSPSKQFSGSGGQFQGYFSNVAAAVAEGSDPSSLFFRFFCIDLYQYAPAEVTSPATSYTASQYSNNNLQKLYDVAYPNEQLGDFFNGSKTSFGQFSGSGGNTAQDYSAAFQLAVWELFYEKNTTHSLGTGNFTNALPNSKAHTIATGWLSQVDSYAGTGYQNWQLYSFESNTNQDFLSARYAVPEPSSMLLAGLGLAGLVMTSRRRRNKA